MPYKIAGVAGTWYEPGTRKGNVGIVWRGQLPDGKWTELVTHSSTQPAAQAHLQRFLGAWHRDRPPATGAAVDLDTAAHHYKETLRSDEEKHRVDRLVGFIGGTTPIAAINQTHVTHAAAGFRATRAAAALATTRGQQKFPPPAAATVNREITTPLRAIVRFAAAQEWRSLIELKAVKPLPGEQPGQPRRIARDGDVDRLLAAIAAAAASCRPTATGRNREADRRRRSMRALYALVFLVHERGYRISEWLRWDWETIALPQASATILLSKPDRWVSFDLSAEAVAALAALEARDAGKVFPWHGRSAVYAAIDAIAPNGVRWRPHESRRAVVTAVIRATGDPVAAQRYVGHANIKTTLRYSVPDSASPQVRAGGRQGIKR